MIGGLIKDFFRFVLDALGLFSEGRSAQPLPSPVLRQGPARAPSAESDQHRLDQALRLDGAGLDELVSLALGSSSTEIRCDALRQIGVVNEGGEVPSVVWTSMMSVSPPIRRAGANAYFEIASPTHAELAETVRQRDDVRLALVEVIGFRYHDEHIPIVVEALDDPSDKVRWASVTALGLLGGEAELALLSDRTFPGRLEQAADRARQKIIERLGRGAGSRLSLVEEPGEGALAFSDDEGRLSKS